MAKQQYAAQWDVKSFTTNDVYKVSLRPDGRWSCACAAWRFAKAPKPDCKHIKKVRGVEEMPTAQFTPAVAKVVATKFKQQAKVVSSGPQYTVIQTRRDICLEEDY